MNKSTKIITAVVIIIILLAIGYFVSKGPSRPTSTKPIKIGWIGPLTGNAAIYGEEARNASVLAVEQINKNGGIQGRLLELFIEDGKCDGRAAINAWQKIVEINQIRVVLGGHCSTETLTLAPLAGDQKVLLLANITSASQIPNEGEWVFRNSAPNSFYGSEGGKFVYYQGFKKIAIITELKDYAVGYSNDFKKSFVESGGTITLEEKFSPGTTDFRSILTKIKLSTPDILLISTQGPETMGLVVKQMRELNIEIPTVFNAAFNAKKLLELTNGYLPKTHFAIVPYAEPKNNFLENYRTRFGRVVAFNPYYIVATYDMVFRLKEALETCGANDKDIGCLQLYFKNAKEYVGATGVIRFDEAHKPLSPLAKVTVVGGEERYELIK